MPQAVARHGRHFSEIVLVCVGGKRRRKKTTIECKKFRIEGILGNVNEHKETTTFKEQTDEVLV